MLITSKYETYCRICGRPIFANDLFDWDKDNRKRHQCIVCFLGETKIDVCPHWAVTHSSYIYERSNKYPTGAGHNKELPLRCMVCGKELPSKSIQNFTPAHTTYIANCVTRQHGGDYPTNRTHGTITVAAFSENNPDYDALFTLKKIFLDPDFSSYQDAIVKHARRIAETYPIMNLDLSMFQTISFDECLKTPFPLASQSLSIQGDGLNSFGMGKLEKPERRYATVHSLNQKNIDAFRGLRQKENSFVEFCTYFKKSPHIFLVEDIVDALRMPGRYMTNRSSFINNIVEEIFFVCNNGILMDPSPENIFNEILDNMERGFEKNTFEGVLTSTISGWVACIYFGAEIDLNKLKELSINAAWTDKLQELMAEQWNHIEPIMKKQKTKE